jgi:hypothetical protein
MSDKWSKSHDSRRLLLHGAPGLSGLSLIAVWEVSGLNEGEKLTKLSAAIHKKSRCFLDFLGTNFLFATFVKVDRTSQPVNNLAQDNPLVFYLATWGPCLTCRRQTETLGFNVTGQGLGKGVYGMMANVWGSGLGCPYMGVMEGG